MNIMSCLIIKQLLLVPYSITRALLLNKYMGAKSSSVQVNRLLQEWYHNKGPLQRPYKYHGFTISLGMYILYCNYQNIMDHPKGPVKRCYSWILTFLPNTRAKFYKKKKYKMLKLYYIQGLEVLYPITNSIEEISTITYIPTQTNEGWFKILEGPMQGNIE